MPTPLGGGQWPGSQVGGPRILQCGPGSISLGEAATPSEVGWGAGRFQHPQLTLWERSNFHRTYIPGDHGPRLEPRVVKLDRCRHSQGRLHLGERHHACPSVTSSARTRPSTQAVPIRADSNRVPSARAAIWRGWIHAASQLQPAVVGSNCPSAPWVDITRLVLLSHRQR